ncbi:hypothetical protein HJFPF1_09850 [Paramyrothecium foliicola]|nr:hypothetical protein HJFPF1_09850 [Paramyrothecium foliicola]
MSSRRTTLFYIFTLSALAGKAAAVSINVQPGDAQNLADSNYGPIPGQDPIYSDYKGEDPTFPGNIRDAVLPTAEGPPGVDDIVWQNLLSAEWVIFEFYQQGVEAFDSSSFVEAGYPNHTFDAIMEIRNNEAGHLRIFQGQISPTSVKPGACKYHFPYYDALSFLALATILEISSMAFLTGLVQTAKLPASHGAMVAIAEVETRHEVWALLDIWKTNPFAGTSDTVFPYATEILDLTNHYVVPGSCPDANPVFPTPRQNLPAVTPEKGTKSLQPGSTIALNFSDPTNQPHFKHDSDYFATFFHGPTNISVPIETSNWPEEPIQAQIPAAFESKGVIILVISDAAGAPSAESIVAGPNFLLLQPAELGIALVA